MWLSGLIRDHGFPSLNTESSNSELRRFESQPGCQTSTGEGWRILHLGDVEVWADDVGVVQLRIDFRNGTPVNPDELGNLAPGWNRDTSLYEILEQLDEAGLTWEIDQRLTFERQLTLRVEKICELVFDLERRELQAVRLVRSERRQC